MGYDLYPNELDSRGSWNLEAKNEFLRAASLLHGLVGWVYAYILYMGDHG